MMQEEGKDGKVLITTGFIEEKTSARAPNESVMMLTPRGSQIGGPDSSLSEELVKQALDSSKSEIGFLRDLTKEQKVKIGNQKAKIAKLKAKNADLKAKQAGTDD